MKGRFIFISLIIIETLVGCEQDRNIRKDIIGSWIYQRMEVDTIYTDGSKYNATFTEGKQRYIISSHDTLYITDITGIWTVKYLMHFHSPNYIVIWNCPIDSDCLVNIPVEFTIEKITKNEMTWRNDYEIRNGKKIYNIMYFNR